jgi:hypothetical protein
LGHGYHVSPGAGWWHWWVTGATGRRKGQLRVLGSPSVRRTKEPRTGGPPGGRGVRGPGFVFAKMSLRTYLRSEDTKTGLQTPRANRYHSSYHQLAFRATRQSLASRMRLRCFQYTDCFHRSTVYYIQHRRTNDGDRDRDRVEPSTPLPFRVSLPT